MKVCAIVAAVGLLLPVGLSAASPDHHEFEATLDAPFRGAADDSRAFTLQFSFPGEGVGVSSVWRLEVRDASGRRIRQWSGALRAGDTALRISVAWDGRSEDGSALQAGLYEVTLLASPGTLADLDAALASLEVNGGPARPTSPPVLQTWAIQVGDVARPALLPFRPMATASRSRVLGPSAAVAPDALPYTVYYANLHSQTNHSDGGGDLATCTGAQNPQSAPFGPADAYTYAYGRGLDVLMASEHNHMYDGSTGTKTTADPLVAHNLYQSGLQAAADFTLGHPGFLAIYGMEWGVISNGGHLNIFGSSELYEWEFNNANQLIGDVYTPKSDYASLYATMRAKGLMGQFNHPDPTGQFIVNATDLGYSADGDDVMVLSEVSNSSAFSVNTTETETSRSSYEGAWKKMLERGFHVAPATNQDNHCANWGASYTNRTATLIPNGVALSMESFLEALRARRVFATHDKTAQLVLTAGDHLMGQRFDNDGPLSVNIFYASSSGHTAATVQLYEGVPGRNGTVTLASSLASTTLTPTTGQHFYYAKVTQDDGKLLWSAPVWVNQLDVSDVIFRDGFGVR